DNLNCWRHCIAACTHLAQPDFNNHLIPTDGNHMNQPRLFRLMLAALLAVFAAFHSSASAQSSPAPPAFAPSERLQELVSNVVKATVERFGKGGLTADKIAVTLIDLNDHERPAWASHRGQEPTYPASVVKLFYLVAAHHQMETGELKATPELERALH